MKTAKFSCKLGKGDILGIGLDVGVGIYDNCQSGASVIEFISDASVDIVMSTGETLAATAVASSSVCCINWSTCRQCSSGLGNIAGAIVGFGIGLFVAYVDDSDLDGNGKSLRDDIKDIVYGLVSGENGEKE